MGTRRYRGLIMTLEQAMFADMPVRITCERCSRFRQMHAFALMRMLGAKRRQIGIRLGEPASGFYCRGCRQKVTAVVSAPRV